MLGKLSVLLQIAFRNLFASWINLIIGLLILGGTLLVVVGGSLLESTLSGMSQSIVGSIAGHLQVYSAGKGELELYGGMGGEDADIGVIPDYTKLERVLTQVPNVREVVPQGIRGAFLTTGNTIDLTLARLRAAVRRASEEPGPEAKAEVASLAQHVQQIVRVLQKDMQQLRATIARSAVDPAEQAALERASSPEFWASFDKDPYGALEFLENKIAPQISDGDLVYLRYVGTDPARFQRTFDRMEIVDGTLIPEGRRGFLFSKFAYEEGFKLKNARRLDRIHEALDAGKHIASDPELQRWVRENVAQPREIVLQLDPLKTKLAVERLQKVLGSSEPDLSKLLKGFFATTDANFAERFAFFYRELAPLLEMYRVHVGDMLTVSTVGRSGYLKSVNVKVYGTFHFKGLEKSPLGGIVNLMDLMSFRDLFGFQSAAEAEELQQLKSEAGVSDIGRESAEAALFGEERTVVSESRASAIDEATLLGGKSAPARQRYEELMRRVYSQQEMDDGVVLNAAVILKDPDKADETRGAIVEAGKRAGLQLKAVSWLDASGIFGQFVTLARVGLSIVAGIIFIVILVILNNAVMMATLRRVQEIGTLRAIGAQRGLVLAMICVETLVLGLVFGTLGIGLGAGIVGLIHSVGIPAKTDEMYFFFSGPVLRPVVSVDSLLPALLAVFGVSLVSTLYPAILATRISPLSAMQSED